VTGAAQPGRPRHSFHFPDRGRSAIFSRVFLSFGFGILAISLLLSTPVALLLLVLVIEPKRQAKGREPLGYFGCLMHAVVLSILLGPIGFMLWFLAEEIGELF